GQVVLTLPDPVRRVADGELVWWATGTDGHLDADDFSDLSVGALDEHVSTLGARLLEPGFERDRVAQYVGHRLASLPRELVQRVIRLVRKVHIHSPTDACTRWS